MGTMKISDEVVAAFSEAYLLELLSRVDTASLPSHAAVRAGMQAAVPYLMPDREALLEVLEKWDVGGWKYEDKASYRERVAMSLLALFGASEVPSDQPS